MSVEWNDQRLGYRVWPRARTRQIDLEQFKEYSTANISDVLGKVLTFDYRVQPVVPIKRPMLGFAVTVQVHPGDNLMIFKAMELAQKGDVIVISDQFDTNNALMGGVMAEMAAHKGIAGFVTDGVVRDTEELEESGVPIFARGLTPVAPMKGGPAGQVNGRIACGGVVVEPGDIVMGDRSGVVVIPQHDAETALAKAAELKTKEHNWLNPEKKGDYPLYRSSHETIVSQGCSFEGEG